MPILDAVKAFTIWNVIQLHQRTDYLVTMHSPIQNLVIMSGFLLEAMESSKREFYDIPGTRKFLGLRIVRLGPGYFMALALSTSYYDFLPFSWFGYAWSSFMMQSLLPATVCAAASGSSGHVHSWLPWQMPTSAGQLWYVSMTMAHAACFPALFNVIRRCNTHTRVLVPFACLLAFRAGMEYFQEHFRSEQTSMDLLSENSALWQLPLMILGMLVARFCEISPRLLSPSAWWWLSPIFFAIAMAVERYEEGSRSVCSIACWCLFMLSAWGVKAGKAHEENVEPWRFLNAVAARLGRYSWGAYLYQHAAQHLFSHLMPNYEDTRWLTLVPSLLAFALGWLSESCFDVPITNFVMKRLKEQAGKVQT